jgi:20S proteasome alpha/beta subunit
LTKAIPAAQAHSVPTKRKTKTAPYSLERLLAGFDPARHGGEVMAFEPVGKEKL